jgi:hypothetical protein
MDLPLHLFRIAICTLLLLILKVAPASAQYKIRGNVYDSSRNYSIELVTVLSSSGKGTLTNADGFYEIEVTEKDSIWFSYLNKPTVKFPVLKIANPMAFDIALQINVTVLKEVKIRPRNYRQDSLQNREDYAKVFNYQKPRLGTVTPTYGQAAGFDLNEIINMFRFRRNKNMLSFQKRLLGQEQEKFVEHRFNKALVLRLTGLNAEARDSFMLLYRPPYLFTLRSDEYTFQKYIKDSYERFKRGLGPVPFFLKEEEEEQ